MKRLSLLDRIPSLVPRQIKPVLRPFLPVYSTTKTILYSVLPEREVTTPYGITLLVEPTNYVERSLANGQFEPEYVEYLITLVEQSDATFYDIGANIGFFSLLHAQESTEEAVTVAFEPLPRNVERLKRNKRLNPLLDFELLETGLSDQDGQATLSVSENHPGEASLTGRNVTNDSLDEVTIPISTVDEVSELLPERPDVVKIDVEGAEIDVLRGMESILDRDQPDILLELHPELIAEKGDEVAELREILRENGYTKLYQIEDGEEATLAGFDLTAIETGTHIHFS